MRSVILGPGGPEISAQGLGCMGMSEFYGPTDDTESLATLEGALDLGVTFFDTADKYGIGAGERLLGAFARRVRGTGMTVATKFGFVRTPHDPPGSPVIRGDAPYVRAACDASLGRLGVDTIDLWYMHRRDVRVPIEETVGAMADLVRAGKVRHLGLSEITADELRAAAAVHPIAAVQSEWSLFRRDVEREVLPACRELGTAFVPYAPLGRGLLAGAVRSADELAPGDFRNYIPWFAPENLQHNLTLLTPLIDIARRHGATPAQVALAWLHQQAPVWRVAVVPIPGTRKSRRAAENAGAVDLHLDPDELAALASICAGVAGERYAPARS